MFALNKVNKSNFNEKALEIFQFQATNTLVYKKYLESLHISIRSIKSVVDIPFLPIEFFKTHSVIRQNEHADLVFLSSGTTKSTRSKHYVVDKNLYEHSFIDSFGHFYGDFQDYCIQAFLPSYLDNKQSSLIYMINYFIQNSKHPLSAFVSEKELLTNIEKLQDSKVLLLGVSYALLDLAEKNKLDLSNYIVMETGGMKGRRKEWTRKELHHFYCEAFQTSKIHSEYGMTELLSQAYSKQDGIFYCPPWMQVSTRPLNEPFSPPIFGQTGVIKIIDLANINSCSFIETADLGKVYKNGSFEVLGRVDFEDLRGCNLMLQ